MICKKNPIFSQREYKKSTNSRKASPCSAWSAFLMPKAMLDSYRVWTKVSIISYFVVFLQKQNLGIAEISMRKTWYAWSVILSSSRTLRSSRPRSVQFIVDWDIEINRWPTLFLLNRPKWGQNVWKIVYDEGTPVLLVRQNTGRKARDESEGQKSFFYYNLGSLIWGIAFIYVNITIMLSIFISIM